MAEFVLGMLEHTPVWVYLLFAFLLYRGIKARTPATVTLEKLALIPAIFLFWDIYDLITYRDPTLITYIQWTIGIISGAIIGYILINPDRLSRSSAPRSIHRPADYSALPFMLLAFGVKYVLGVLNRHCSRRFTSTRNERSGYHYRRHVRRRFCGEIYPLRERLAQTSHSGQLLTSPTITNIGHGFLRLRLIKIIFAKQDRAVDVRFGFV